MMNLFHISRGKLHVWILCGMPIRSTVLKHTPERAEVLRKSFLRVNSNNMELFSFLANVIKSESTATGKMLVTIKNQNIATLPLQHLMFLCFNHVHIELENEYCRSILILHALSKCVIHRKLIFSYFI